MSEDTKTETKPQLYQYVITGAAVDSEAAANIIAECAEKLAAIGDVRVRQRKLGQTGNGSDTPASIEARRAVRELAAKQAQEKARQLIEQRRLERRGLREERLARRADRMRERQEKREARLVPVPAPALEPEE